MYSFKSGVLFGELLLELQLHMHARCRSVLHNEFSSHEKLKNGS